MLTLKKIIHIDQYPVYFNAGWRWESHPDSFGIGTVLREFQSDRQLGVLDFKAPPLLVPFRIKRPLMSTVGMGLFDSVSPVYSQADAPSDVAAKIFLRGLEAVFSIASLHKTTITKPIGNSTYALRVFGCFDNEGQIDSYVAMLREMYGKNIASSGFSSEYADFADAWFDFGSKCVLSFDKNYLHRLDSHLRISFKDIS